MITALGMILLILGLLGLVHVLPIGLVISIILLILGAVVLFWGVGGHRYVVRR